MAIEISARKRETQGTGAARRLRRKGLVPGIVYGGTTGAVNIEIDHKALYLSLRNERFHASILTLDLAGSKEQVLLRAVNMHPFKPQVQHMVKVLLCLPEAPQPDAADALAIAICHGHSREGLAKLAGAMRGARS